jgi:hypothetical protein
MPPEVLLLVLVLVLVLTDLLSGALSRVCQDTVSVQ